MCVEVNGEVLNYVLCNCPFLEVLRVEASNSLMIFKHSSPLLKLKHLEISHCINLLIIEISAINIVSLKYCGCNTTLLLGDVPNLVDLNVSYKYYDLLVNTPSQISRYLSQLETLVLKLPVQKYVKFPKFPELRNLRQLELIIYAVDVDSLLCCTSLLKASPVLHKFAVKLLELKAPAKGKIKVRRAKYPHQCLKVVELIGFVGCTIDMELAPHVLNNVVSLEKIIIDTRSPDEDMLLDSMDLEKKLAAQTCARQLETRLPPGVELVIL
ncbi:F-box/LRR-repeat protein At3g58900-like [Fagus crenata]